MTADQVMTAGDDPFPPGSGDPFASHDMAPGAGNGPPTSYGGASARAARAGVPHNGLLRGSPSGRDPVRPLEWQPALNTYAVLAPIFGVLVPPAGVALGHLALPQVKRTGERGWLAAVCGLVLGYLLSTVLVGLLIWLLAAGPGESNRSGAAPAPGVTPSPSVVTSVAPAPMRPRHKLDLNQATVGKCVEIEKRDSADSGGGVSNDEALDLFEVPCEQQAGVYTVVARVPTDAECNSTYVAAPPDRSFAVCLNRYWPRAPEPGTGRGDTPKYN